MYGDREPLLENGSNGTTGHVVPNRGMSDKGQSYKENPILTISQPFKVQQHHSAVPKVLDFHQLSRGRQGCLLEDALRFLERGGERSMIQHYAAQTRSGSRSSSLGLLSRIQSILP